MEFTRLGIVRVNTSVRLFSCAELDFDSNFDSNHPVINDHINFLPVASWQSSDSLLHAKFGLEFPNEIDKQPINLQRI